MQTFLLRLAIGYVRYVGTLVKAQTDSMPDVFFNNAEPVLVLDVFNDRKTDIGDSATRLDRFDRQIKTIERTLDNITGFLIHLANDNGL